MWAVRVGGAITGESIRAQNPRSERISGRGQAMRGVVAAVASSDRCSERSDLAFTRYCYYQYCMLNNKTGGRGETVYCAILISKYNGGGG